MSFSSMLDQVRSEGVLREKREAQRLKDFHQAFAVERTALTAELDRQVTPLLQTLANHTWGDGRYSLLRADSMSTSWHAIRESVGAGSQRFSIIAEVEALEESQGPREDMKSLLQQTRFCVIASKNITSPPFLSDLETALVKAFEIGPKVGSLDEELAQRLKDFPYRSGESDSSGKWIAILAAVGAVAVLVLWSIDWNSVDPAGVATQAIRKKQHLWAIYPFVALAGSAVSLAITRLGARFDRLASWEQAIAIVALIPSAIGIFPFVAGALALAVGLAVTVGIMILLLHIFCD